MGKRKAVYWILLALIMVTVTGCGYTLEEKREMKRYEKQGRENAKNYIREKYGIDAKITEINCEKYSSSPVPDFFPSPTGNVFVKMKYKGADFLVAISGQKKNMDGSGAHISYSRCRHGVDRYGDPDGAGQFSGSAKQA